MLVSKKFLFYLFAVLLLALIGFVSIGTNSSYISQVKSFVSNNLNTKDFGTCKEFNPSVVFYTGKINQCIDLIELLAEHDELLRNGDYQAKVTGIRLREKLVWIGLNNGFALKIDFETNAFETFDLVPPDLDSSSHGALISWLFTDDHTYQYFVAKKPEGNTQLLLSMIDLDPSGKTSTRKTVILHDSKNGAFVSSDLGGAILEVDDNIILGVGKGAYEVAPKDSLIDPAVIFGKFLSIPKIVLQKPLLDLKKDATLLSVGHKNPQGALLGLNAIINVEHGPEGGDEINAIPLSKETVYNYGYGKCSYGWDISARAALRECHADMIEPKMYWTPSIAPSYVARCPFNEGAAKSIYSPNCLLITTLKDESIHVIKHTTKDNLNNRSLIPDESATILSSEKIKVGQRVRRIDTASMKAVIATDRLSIYLISWTERT